MGLEFDDYIHGKMHNKRAEIFENQFLLPYQCANNFITLFQNPMVGIVSLKCNAVYKLKIKIKNIIIASPKKIKCFKGTVL